MEQPQHNSKLLLWTGSILKVFVALFLLFDAIMKVIRHQKYVEGTEQLGLPASSVQPLGLFLFSFTILYIIPRTTIVGCLLLTAYLGGAAAITYAANNVGHPYLFPVAFAVMMWLAAYLRNEKIRTVLRLTA